MSEQTKKSTAAKGTREKKIEIKNKNLLFLILIVVFFLTTCVCVIFLSRAIKSMAGNVIIGLWSTAVCLSLLAAIILAILLLTKKFKEKWKAEIKADSEVYVSSMRSTIKKANEASICPEEPSAFESEVMTDSYLILQKRTDRSEMEGDFVAISDDRVSRKSKRVPQSGIIVPPRKKAAVPKPIRKNSKVDALQEAMLNNLTKMQEDCDWSERITETIFQVAIAVCIFGLLILTASILLPVILKQSFETTYPVAIGGVISQFITGTLFVIHNRSLKQQNIYRQDLRAYESILSTTSLISQISSPTERDRMLKEVIRKTLKRDSSPTPVATDPSDEDEKDDGSEKEPK